MELHFGKVAIIGVGLLGASLGMAIRNKKLADEVMGIGRNISTLEKALQKGAIDNFSTELFPSISNADFIILCTPVQSAIKILQSIGQYISSEKAIITDVCSTKVDICKCAQSIWHKNSPFIGSHPLAGSEKYGPEYARADFYDNTICLLEKGTNARTEVKKTVWDFWNTLGTKVIEVDMEEHDFFMAYTSHLPHVIASALAQVTEETKSPNHFIGGGFRDTTRIAESRPEIWKDIILTNQKNILSGIEGIQKKLEEFKLSLQNNEVDRIMDFFKQGNDSRQRLFNK
ncbi:MAG: prephenate dehydrogenase [Candidatus Hydrogenedens sp.]